MNFTASELAAAIRRKETSSVELTRLCLSRIEASDAEVHSFVALDAERALRAARQADAEMRAGRDRGPLHGVPYAVKDVYDAAGFVTTGGSPAFLNNVAKTNATAVERLDRAGAVLLGKTATHELTYGGVDLDLPWPPARNPWDPARDPGGSSTGSAVAVAASFSPIALGTDTGGSVRVPAGLCGIVGLKPTYGRISRYGVMLNSYSLDHCGPMTWTVRDCALALQAIAGYDPRDPASSDAPVPNFSEGLEKGVEGLRIGVVSHFWERDLPAPDEVCEAMDAALHVLTGLGAQRRDVTLHPLADYAGPKVTIQLPEIFSVYGDLVREKPQSFGPKFRKRIGEGDAVRAVDYVRAQERRRELTSQMAEVFADVDVLVTSGPYGPAPFLEEAAAAQLNRVEITVPFSMTGFPAISVCIGFTREGLPLSMQIAGKPFDEATVLRAAHAYEAATPWRSKRPQRGLAARA